MMKLRIRIFLLATLLAVAAGCATHRVDWNARVGTYTFDQAIVELGPPDKQAKLSDGKNVAEWVSRYSSGGTTTAFGSGYYNGAGSVSVMQTAPVYYESKLRLTFTTNHVLSAWAKD